MPLHPPSRRVPRALPVLWAVALLALCAGGATAIAAAGTAKAPKHHPKVKRTTLAGAWSGRYGGSYSGTFTLRWTQSKSTLKGTIALSNPRGTYGINGTVHGSAIKFGAVGVGATYTGSVSGKTMKGSYKSPAGGGTWSARKTS